MPPKDKLIEELERKSDTLMPLFKSIQEGTIDECKKHNIKASAIKIPEGVNELRSVDLNDAKNVLNKALTLKNKQVEELRKNDLEYCKRVCIQRDEIKELKSQLQEKDKELFITKSAIASLKIFHKKQRDDIFKEIEAVRDKAQYLDLLCSSDFWKELKQKHKGAGLKDEMEKRTKRTIIKGSKRENR